MIRIAFTASLFFGFVLTHAATTAPRLTSQPGEIHSGILVATFDQNGQWNNNPKEITLVDSMVATTKVMPIAFASDADYRTCEINSGAAVVMRLVPVKHVGETWYVFQSLERLR